MEAGRGSISSEFCGKLGILVCLPRFREFRGESPAFWEVQQVLWLSGD